MSSWGIYCPYQYQTTITLIIEFIFPILFQYYFKEKITGIWIKWNHIVTEIYLTSLWNVKYNFLFLCEAHVKYAIQNKMNAYGNMILTILKIVVLTHI